MNYTENSSFDGMNVIEALSNSGILETVVSIYNISIFAAKVILLVSGAFGFLAVTSNVANNIRDENYKSYNDIDESINTGSNKNGKMKNR